MLKSDLTISRLRLAECYGNQTTCYVMVHCGIHTLEGEPIKATPTTHQTPKGSRFGFPKAAHQSLETQCVRHAGVCRRGVTYREPPSQRAKIRDSKVGLHIKQYLCIICPDSAMEITCTVKAKDLAI